MGAAERDTTAEWLLSEAERPPLIGELERQVVEALATARATEAAVMTVGAAAIDAAEQAQRAAALAERASAAALDAQVRVASITTHAVSSPPASEAEENEGLSDFSARADRLVARLRQLQRVPLPAPSPSGSAGRPQPAH